MENLNVMTVEQFNAVADPLPGVDPSWDSLPESEKACLRTPQRQRGTTLKDLLRDREAHEMQAPNLKIDLQDE